MLLYPDKDEEQDEGFWNKIWRMVGGYRGIFYKGVGK
jgi:muconolactone delta-isomerase